MWNLILFIIIMAMVIAYAVDKAAEAIGRRRK